MARTSRTKQDPGETAKARAVLNAAATSRSNLSGHFINPFKSALDNASFRALFDLKKRRPSKGGGKVKKGKSGGGF